jgi:acyl carrier protein phosphodiesterase
MDYICRKCHQLNYLAHSFLSFDDPELLFGQFIADDIKGNKYQQFPTRIKEGILLHRYIDYFTDNFPECLELRKEFRSVLGLYSGVAIDVFFDHILAVQWDSYHTRNQQHFIQNVYDTLDKKTNLMSEKRRFIHGKMKEHDWLGRYKTLEGIQLTMNQMSKRVQNGEILTKSPELLEKHMKIITEVFEIFFPKLISASKSKLDTFATNPI